MHNRSFNEFEERLLKGGTSRYYVQRVIEELQDHLADLQADAVSDGMSLASSNREALERLGSLDQIADEMLSRPEMKSWAYRHPVLDHGIRSFGEVMELPALPILAVVNNSALLLRWFSALLAGASAAFVLFFALQFLIAFG
jgi:hypothetical protein